jgi:hypothetical protein
MWHILKRTRKGRVVLVYLATVYATGLFALGLLVAGFDISGAFRRLRGH